ncbi:hypothetical protein ACPJHQ_20885 [Rossellomorea sp. H39__3]
MKKVIGILIILMSLPLLFHSQIKGGVYKGFNEKLLVAASEGKGEVKKTMLEKLYLSDSTDVETSDIKAVLRIPSIELEEPIFQGQVNPISRMESRPSRRTLPFRNEYFHCGT